jgi:hypothetical protein
LTALAGIAVAVSPAGASTITLSGVSSDASPASQLDATLTFDVGDFDLGNGGDELRLVLHNPSAGEGGDALFNVNEIYFNAASGVTALTLLSATHSVNGDVFAAWQPVETAAAADGFGIFDYALTDGVGEMNPAIAMPGQSVTFLFDIAGTGPFDMNDFIEANAMGYTAAAKFVNGPDDPEDPGMEDSAFGAVPEPGTALLLGLGLVALGVRRR